MGDFTDVPGAPITETYKKKILKYLALFPMSYITREKGEFLLWMHVCVHIYLSI